MAMAQSSTAHLVGLIGTGTSGSISPLLHESEAAHHGLEYRYRPLDLQVLDRPPEDVGEILLEARRAGFDAVNVTHPCKQLVLPFLDEVTEEVQELQAANTVLISEDRMVGHNTDRSGFASGLAEVLGDVSGDEVVQVGAGGAGAAVAAALLDAGVATLHLCDPDGERSAALAERLGPHHPGQRILTLDPQRLPDVLPLADGVANATPVGMDDFPGAPFDLGLLRPTHWVAEVIYRPMDTELVLAAQDLGCRVLDGGRMVIGQAVDTFRLVTGIEPDRERMRGVLIDHLAGQS